jgi:NAD(P)H-dependent flavin oxidoreductase YrpB (nitropropane dioxygenase family)
MIRTPVCDLLHIEHPIALGGMGSVYGPALTAAVSNAGGEADIDQQENPAGLVENNPERPFATLNCRIAKVSFTAPLASFACWRGRSTARLSH